MGSRKVKQHPNAGKLQPGYVRYTVILSRDELDQLKGYAWYTRRKIKDIFAEMVGEFLENHADELPNRIEQEGHVFEVTGVNSSFDSVTLTPASGSTGYIKVNSACFGGKFPSLGTKVTLDFKEA